MINELFKFPIVMIDGDNEERKSAENRLLGKGDDEGRTDYDIIIGEAEYPYYDFIGIEDRWLPQKRSLNKAITGKFDACGVRFVNAGYLLVPWNKEKFKEAIRKFAEEYEAALPPKPSQVKELKILTLTPDQYQDIVNNDKTDNNEQE